MLVFGRILTCRQQYILVTKRCENILRPPVHVINEQWPPKSQSAVAAAADPHHGCKWIVHAQGWPTLAISHEAAIHLFCCVCSSFLRSIVLIGFRHKIERGSIEKKSFVDLNIVKLFFHSLYVSLNDINPFPAIKHWLSFVRSWQHCSWDDEEVFSRNTILRETRQQVVKLWCNVFIANGFLRCLCNSVTQADFFVVTATNLNWGALKFVYLKVSSACKKRKRFTLSVKSVWTFCSYTLCDTFSRLTTADRFDVVCPFLFNVSHR